MKILRMRASFGKLQGELSLNDGFQCLCLPNEGGKSTWSAFLLAMLYGIDTSERANAANQGLPAKERYKPWDGRAMEGAIELLWQGKHITIERSTAGRVPMGAFCAYETESGNPVTELTGENCGRMLCGVERSVFERTAFIHQLGLAVTQDAALEKRLGALVATGEDGAKTYLELEKELRNRKNQLTGRSGRQAPLKAKLQEVKQTLSELTAMQQEAMTLSARKEEQRKALNASQALLERIRRAKEAQKRSGLLTLEEKIRDEETLCRRLEETADALPPEETLHDLRRRLDARENALQTAKMDAAFGLGEAKAPPVPQGFSGLSAEEAVEKARQDEETYRQLTAQKPKKYLWLLCLSLLLAVAGGALCCFRPLWGIAPLAAGLLGAALCLLLRLRSRNRCRDASHEAQLIALRYGLEDGQNLCAIAQDYAEEIRLYEQEKAALDEQKNALSLAVEQEQDALKRLLAEICCFAPDCRDASSCREALTAALRTREQLMIRRRTLEALRQQQQSLRLVLGSGSVPEEDPEALTLDEAKITYEAHTAEQKLADLSSRLDQTLGAISAKGDAVELEAQTEQLQAELAAIEERSGAIDLALDALKTADESLRSRFSPQITAEAGRILAALTGEKYPTLLLQPDLRLSVREKDAAVSRPAAAMSRGTADQMYLALRLAMCRRLLPPDTPVILDDALVNFDFERAQAAIALLRQEAETRQIILFSCRDFGI